MRAVVDAVRPRYVVVENVAALLGDTEAFSIVLGDLSDLGFAVEWDVVSACSVGAPHMRRRLFVVAYPEGDGELLSGRVERSEVGDTQRDVCHWSQESEPHRVVDGVPRRVDRNHALGNAVVPQVAELVGRRLLGVAA
jgi:DNA (cytosine-5)-methyltransferase 1